MDNIHFHQDRTGQWVEIYYQPIGGPAVRFTAQVVGGDQRGYSLDRPWPDDGSRTPCARRWIARLATPEEIARVQLDQLGAEDAL